MKDGNSVKDKIKSALNRENIAKAVFITFAAFSILAVVIIVIYILYASIPAFREVGFFKFIFGGKWQVSEGVYGIFPMIVTSLALTLFAVALGGTLAVFTAIFIVYYCPKRLKKLYSQLINLLAGIPSLVYGYFGLTLLKPLMQDTFGIISASGVLLSGLVLSIMILPTVCSVAKNSLENVPMHYYEGALALGCTNNQAVWKTCLPAAKNGIISALILGIGRAIGETMAVQMLLGGAVNYPYSPFLPVRSMTSNIVQEFADAEGMHRSALIATGFILLIFILIINAVLRFIKRNDAISGNKFFSRKFKEGNEKVSGFAFKKRGSAQDVLCILSYTVAAFVAAVLILIVGFTAVKGLPHLSFDFLFGKSSNANTTLAPAFVSTGLIILIALAIALPLGIGAAIYLNEYAKRGSFFVKTVRLFNDTLSGVPSIIFGLFGALFFGGFMNMGYSILGGALTMVLMILPTVIRSTEQSLSEVPDSMREASYALGAGKLKTVFSVVLPQAIAGIITSIILSIGRIVGESAALIFTAGSFIRMPKGITSPGSTFAVLMYKFMSEGLEVDKCYATGAVLIIAVIILNILVTVTEHCFNNKKTCKKGIISRAFAKLARRKNEEN
ncbi:MAG TPA: phosphate ABC transporter permease [Clostridiales bacterium]|nr:phosphate ABC transporter permease [Clostridiales bacterium]